MSSLGEHIDDVWDAIHALVAGVTHSGESIGAVKGRGHAINERIRTYTMLGPTYMEGGKTATRTWWLSSFLILCYYDEPVHTTREEAIRDILDAITTAIEGSRQLSALVETSEVTRMVTMIFPGFERSNGQLLVTCRFSWNITAAYAVTGDGQLGKSWDTIIDAVGVEVAKVTAFEVIYYSDRGTPGVTPCAYVILKSVEGTPFTTEKTINKLTIDIPIFTKNADITAGEVLGLTYAGNVVEELGDDPRLGGLIEGVESVTLVPNWAGQNGYERSVIAVQLEAVAVR